MIVWIIAIVVLVFFGKLIYDREQNKKAQNVSLDEFEAKEKFQKLAGIGVPKTDENPKVIDGYKELADKWSKAGFPEPDQSIPVSTTKITTIDTNFGSDNDPLASVPMSRLSKQAKQKMAEIAKEDITKQLEQNAERFIEQVESKLPDEMRKAMLEAPIIKPKRKYNKKPKQ